MTVAALIISILALLVSGAALAYSRRADTREEARRHSERAPKFDAAIESMNTTSDHPWYRLRLTLTAFDEALTAKVHLISDHGEVVFTPGQRGLLPPLWPPLADAQTDGPLVVGASATWRVDVIDRDEPRPTSLRLHVEATALYEKRPWLLLVNVEVPPRPPRGGRLLL